MTKEQIELVEKLDDLKNQIQESDDNEKIILLIREAVKRAHQVEPRTIQYYDGRQYPNIKGKNFMLNQLHSEIQFIDDGTYSDMKEIIFQVTASLVQLMLQFAEGGIDQINNILNK
jgi:hypothetical protein